MSDEKENELQAIENEIEEIIKKRREYLQAIFNPKTIKYILTNDPKYPEQEKLSAWYYIKKDFLEYAWKKEGIIQYPTYYKLERLTIIIENFGHLSYYLSYYKSSEGGFVVGIGDEYKLGENLLSVDRMEWDDFVILFEVVKKYIYSYILDRKKEELTRLRG